MSSMRLILCPLFTLFSIAFSAFPQDKPPKDATEKIQNWNGQTAWAPSGLSRAPLSGPLPLVAVSPCRVVDTRPSATFQAGETRNINVPASNCGIPATAQAYSLNITVVPANKLSYLTAWPAGQSRPLVSTLNSFEGAILANAAIVPAGVSGAISIFVTDRTDVIIDINGYFSSTSGAASLPFYSLSPCRVIDTRPGQAPAGEFGPPVMTAQQRRSFRVPNSLCGIPATAKAYSLNVTVVPRGALAYLSIWPTGQTQPVVSTLNSFEGIILANAAIVPAGTNGSIDIFVTNVTDVIVDINGYFLQ